MPHSRCASLVVGVASFAVARGNVVADILEDASWLDGMDTETQTGVFAVRHGVKQVFEAMATDPSIGFAISGGTHNQFKTGSFEPFARDSGMTLSEWLQSLTINFPKFTTPPTTLTPPIIPPLEQFTATLQTGTCNNIGVQIFWSQQIPPNMVQAAAYGLTANCQVSVMTNFLSAGHPESLPVSLSFNLLQSSISGTMVFVSDGGNPPLLEAIMAPAADCKANMDVSITSINLNSWLLNMIVGFMKTVFQTQMQTEINQISCNVATQAFATISKSISKSSVAARQFLGESPTWPAMPVAAPWTALENEVFASWSGTLALGGITPSANSTGLFPLTHTIDLPNLGLLNFTVLSAAMNPLPALESMTQVPSGLNISIGGTDLSVAIPMHVTYAPLSIIQAGLLSEHFNVSVVLHGPMSGFASVFFGFNKTHMKSMTMDTLMSQPGCIRNVIDKALMIYANFSIPPIQTTVTPTQASQYNPLDQSLDQLINNFLSTLLQNYHPAISALANQAVAIGASTLNSKLSSVVQAMADKQWPGPCVVSTGPTSVIV